MRPFTSDQARRIAADFQQLKGETIYVGRASLQVKHVCVAPANAEMKEIFVQNVVGSLNKTPQKEIEQFVTNEFDVILIAQNDLSYTAVDIRHFAKTQNIPYNFPYSERA